MKLGVIRTPRSSSARRPSVRCCCDSLAGLKLILTPDLHGLKAARGGAEEALGDVREALGRVRHVEVIQIIAQKASAGTRLAQVAQLLRRRAPQPLFIYQGLDHPGRGLARVDELHALAQGLLNHAPEDWVVRAAEHDGADLPLPKLAQVLFGDRARHI